MTKNVHDETYRQSLRCLLNEGEKNSRNRWVHPNSKPLVLSFDRQHGFFYLTTANVVWGQVVRSMMSFIQGDVPYENNTKANFLDRVFDKAHVNFGTRRNFFKWDNPYGGHQDQIQTVIDDLKTNPLKTHVITNWNPSFIRRLPEPPSTSLLHFVCEPRSVTDRQADHDSKGFNLGEPKYALNLYVTNLSQDLYRTLPELMSFYGLLLELIANDTGMAVGTLQWVIHQPYIHDSDRDKVRDRIAKQSNPPASFTMYRHCEFKKVQPALLEFEVRQQLI